MDLPDESQWDETACKLPICQHPQCWASIRRIERGHPRTLGSPCRTSLDTEDKLPVLSVVNISDACFKAEGFAHRQLQEFTLTKAHSLLSRGSELDSRFQRRHLKGLPDKSLINSSNRSPRLSVLNLNETQLPCSEVVRNMVVIWIPEESEKNASFAEKAPPFPNQRRKKKRTKLAGNGKLSPGLSGRQYTEARSRTPGVVVPPSSPLHETEQLTSESIPVLAKAKVLPQDLLKELLLCGEKTMLSPEIKIQLDMMKRNPPVEKNQPESAISSKMFLTVHRITLQRPAMRYSEQLKKLHCTLKKEGHEKQQQRQQPQQRKDAQNAKSDLKTQNTGCKHSVAAADNPIHGHRTLPGQEQNVKQQLRMEIGGVVVKQDFTERSPMGDLDSFLNVSSDAGSSDISEAECFSKNNKASMETVLEAPVASQERISRNLSENMIGTWEPELKFLRILQEADEEAEGK